jgi:hypothetical protein
MGCDAEAGTVEADSSNLWILGIVISIVGR